MADSLYRAGPPAIWHMSAPPGAVKRTVKNIVVNAVRYGVSASVEVREEANRIDIDVTDSGPRIPADRR